MSETLLLCSFNNVLKMPISNNKEFEQEFIRTEQNDKNISKNKYFCISGRSLENSKDVKCSFRI